MTSATMEHSNANTANSAWKSETFGLKGLRCAGCVNKVEKNLNGMQAVQKASVNLALGQLDLNWNPELLSTMDLQKKIAELGFELVVPNRHKTLIMPIEGMRCSSCIAKIEGALTSQAGVRQASVNLATARAIIEFDPDQTDEPQLQQVVRSTGFQPKSSTIRQADQREGGHLDEYLNNKRRFQWAAAFTLPLFVLAMAEMLGIPLPKELSATHSPQWVGGLQLLLTLPVMWAGRSFYRFGWPALFKGRPDMDSLVALGTSAAVIYSLWNWMLIITGSATAMTAFYYETAAVIITLILLGKTLEMRSRGRASEAMAGLLNLQPQSARILRDGQQIEVDSNWLQPQDIILIKPGERVPADGVVKSGESTVDESALTGESVPVDVTTGQQVKAGTVNLMGSLQVEVSQSSEQTVLAQIIQFVERSQASKAPIARLADRVAGVFVPVVIGIALLSAAGWLISGASVAQALQILIAVLVIACPCAMGLATPAAIMVGSGRGSREGVLFKDAVAFETLSKIKVFAFDKTGTLTHGKLKVQEVLALNDVTANWLTLAASAESHSEHPIARAVLEFTRSQQQQIVEPERFEAEGGFGVKAVVDGKSVLVGKSELLERQGLKPTDLPEKFAGLTQVWVAVDGTVCGVLGLFDSLRQEAPKVIKQLKNDQLHTVILTGDRPQTAEKLAAGSGISQVIGGLLPQQKAEHIVELRKKYGPVAMLGDGINDAPALSEADLGISVMKGSQLAMDSADVVLMKDDLNYLIKMRRLATATVRTIKQNLFWAFAYNAVGIPVAAGLLIPFGGPGLNPMLAALAMAFSSVSVITNALRLKHRKLD